MRMGKLSARYPLESWSIRGNVPHVCAGPAKLRPISSPSSFRWSSSDQSVQVDDNRRLRRAQTRKITISQSATSAVLASLPFPFPSVPPPSSLRPLDPSASWATDRWVVHTFHWHYSRWNSVEYQFPFSSEECTTRRRLQWRKHSSLQLHTMPKQRFPIFYHVDQTFARIGRSKMNIQFSLRSIVSALRVKMGWKGCMIPLTLYVSVDWLPD